MEFEKIIDNICSILDLSKYCVVATASKSGVVSTSTVCFVREGLSVYFQTDASFEKIKNISENPNVALTVGSNYNFKGKAKVIGHPSDFPNFIDLLIKKDPKTYQSYSNLKNEVLVKIDLTEAKIWKIENSKIAKNVEKILKINLKTKSVTEIVCDKM